MVISDGLISDRPAGFPFKPAISIDEDDSNSTSTLDLFGLNFVINEIELVNSS